MALVKCSECGKQVSELASACPGCGAPIRSDATVHVKVTRTGAKFEGVGFGLIVLGMFALMADHPVISTLGTLAMLSGFVVFIIGRFK